MDADLEPNDWLLKPGVRVLTPVDVHLLPRETELKLQPLLTNGDPTIRTKFDIMVGKIAVFNVHNADEELPFERKDELATRPPVAELVLVTPRTPWTTIIKNKIGVTLLDIFAELWKDYSRIEITEDEIASLSPRLQEQVRRAASSRMAFFGPPPRHLTPPVLVASSLPSPPIFSDTPMQPAGTNDQVPDNL